MENNFIYFPFSEKKTTSIDQNYWLKGLDTSSLEPTFGTSGGGP